MLDCYTQLFNDVQDYFGKDLMMFDGYYLTHEKQINNLCKKLIKKSAAYANLLKSFDQHYEGWIDFVKGKTETEPEEIVSISHELIERNKKTGLCLYNCSSCLAEEDKVPDDCEFFSLENVDGVNFEPCQQPFFLFNHGMKNIKTKPYAQLCKDFDFPKQNGIARTIIMYWALVSREPNSYIYFIRPRVGHGIYNGSLVLLLRRPLNESEFNILSSFLNEVLCETAIAKFIDGTRVKTEADFLKKQGTFFWGGEASNNTPKNDTIELQKTLRIATWDLVRDENLNKCTCQNALAWASEFCKAYFDPTIELSKVSYPVGLLPYDCTNYTGNSIHTNLVFRETFIRLFSIRKIVTLLTECIQSNAGIRARTDMKKILPYVILGSIKEGNPEAIRTDSNFKRIINKIGLSHQTTKDNWTKIITQYPYISDIERLWLDRTVPYINERIEKKEFDDWVTRT